MRRRLAAFCLVAALAAGCGGARQDADEPRGAFALDVLSARFPRAQRIAQSSRFVMRVRNRGDRALPNLAVTVTTDPEHRGDARIAFGQKVADPALASRGRPVWIVDGDPTGGQSAYTNTWSFGPLGAGRTKTVRWRLTAVRAGRFTVRYRVAPGLDGTARSTAGSRVSGAVRVTVDRRPAPTRVDERGRIVRGV